MTNPSALVQLRGTRIKNNLWKGRFQFRAHAQALPGNPYDGHTLAEVIPAIEQLVGNTIERLHADAWCTENLSSGVVVVKSAKDGV